MRFTPASVNETLFYRNWADEPILRILLPTDTQIRLGILL